LNSKQIECPVCGTLAYKIIFHDHNRRDNINCSGVYVQCKECSLIYLQERPPWEEIVKFYYSLDKDLTTNSGMVDVEELNLKVEKIVPEWIRLLRKVRFRPHSWPLESVPPGSKRLLDFGCGSGAKVLEFAQRGYEVWGVDVGDDAIRLCKKLLPQGHFLKGELLQIGLPDRHFDYIRIDNVLEHVPNPKEVVRECRRILSTHGRILIYVPHGRSLSMRFMKGNSISSWIPFHLQLFTQNSLKRLLVEAGFKDVCIYAYNPTSWLPLSIVQWKNKKQPSMKFNYPHWLTCVCYPVGWLATKFGMAEELVITGKTE
jgi:2-polyprenyl-3-methyl-5-hydroxy-6-metoxy-1,4-benzoquinol methylase